MFLSSFIQVPLKFSARKALPCSSPGRKPAGWAWPGTTALSPVLSGAVAPPSTWTQAAGRALSFFPVSFSVGRMMGDVLGALYWVRC